LAPCGYYEIFRIIHPHAITSVKLGGKPVAPEVLSSIWGFFLLFLGLFIVAALVMTFLGLDMISALASVAASMGNIGPGLGLVGPTKNYFAIPFIGKWLVEDPVFGAGQGAFWWRRASLIRREVVL
jgi:trk system potassium uptake protein TrkH